MAKLELLLFFSFFRVRNNQLKNKEKLDLRKTQQINYRSSKWGLYQRPFAYEAGCYSNRPQRAQKFEGTSVDSSITHQHVLL
mgnify:CR=1 FL=1